MNQIRSRLNLAALRSLLKRGVIPYAVAAAVLLVGLTGVAAATGTFSGGTTPTPTSSVRAATSTNGQLAGFPGGGGGDNIVQVINHSDGRVKMDGRVRLDQISGPNVGPKNEAFSYSSCTDCDTVAVALQVDLYRAGAHDVRPFNKAMAVNFQCTRCVTVALAFQYNIPVADPHEVPSGVRKMIQEMNVELSIIRNPHENVTDAVQQINAVISQFQEYAVDLTAQQDQATDATTSGASPMPDQSSSPGASATPTVSGSPTPSPTPSLQATPSSSP